MATDEHMLEPLLAEAEGYDFPMGFDENLLKELRSLDEAEQGNAGQGPDVHVEDEDVYKMRELIREKPKDVIQYIEEEGVAKLGEFEIQDAVAFKAFGKDNIMTTGAEHYEVDWQTMWRDQLSEYSRSAAGMGWTTKITMEAHVVNLRDAAAEGSRGLLHPLLKRYQAHGCSAAVFALPAVQAVIHYKWTTWARRFLLYELACYCFWLLGFTVFTLIFQQEDWTMTFWELLQDRNGFLATVFSLLTLVPMAPFLYMELCTIASYGMGWVNMWNLMDLVSYILQIVVCVLHLQRDFVDEGWFSVLVATQHVLMWTKLHYFAKAFSPTKNTIIDTIRIIVDDMKWFLLFLALTMVGFGLAFYSLYRQDRDEFMDFANFWHSLASMFSYLLAMFDYNVFYNSKNPTAAMVLFVIFEFLMNVLLLNVLIASMTNSYSKITQDEGLRFLCSKAEIIDELETTLPHWVRSKDWYPPFVHILKFHPDSTYEVNLTAVWSGMGLMENNLLGAQNETRLRVEELEDRLSKLHKKLDVLIKLFISSMSPGHALGLSRQATGGYSGTGAAGHGAFGLHAGHVGSPYSYMGTGIGGYAKPYGAAAAGAGHAGTPRGGLRHAATTLSNLPDSLAAVSGPFGIVPPMQNMTFAGTPGRTGGAAQQQHWQQQQQQQQQWSGQLMSQPSMDGLVAAGVGAARVAVEGVQSGAPVENETMRGSISLPAGLAAGAGSGSASSSDAAAAAAAAFSSATQQQQAFSRTASSGSAGWHPPPYALHSAAVRYQHGAGPFWPAGAAGLGYGGSLAQQQQYVGNGHAGVLRGRPGLVQGVSSLFGVSRRLGQGAGEDAAGRHQAGMSRSHSV